MLQFRIQVIIFMLSFAGNIMGQEIKAELQNVHQDEDSLIITLTLQNATKKPVYLIGLINSLKFEDYIPNRVNYGSFNEEMKARKNKEFISRNGNVGDTIMLIIPTTSERFQLGAKGERINVFKTLDKLQEVYHNRKMSTTVPLPPVDDISSVNNFLDADLYELLSKGNMLSKESNSSFYEQIITLQPKEKKSISIDLGYLLLRKATYRILFDYKAENRLSKKETRFIKSNGFHKFKGRVTSNIIDIISE